MNSKVKDKYIIIGSSHFIDSSVEKIISGLSEPEICRFYGDEMNEEDFFSFIFTAPLFSDTKVAVILNSEKLSKLDKYIHKASQSSDTFIIFTFNEFKKLKDTKAYEIVSESKNKSERALIVDMFASKGFKISSKTAADIFDLCMNNMNIVKNELEKVEIYFYGVKEKPSEKDILDLISFSKNESIFTFIDFFMNKNKSAGLMTLENILLSGENMGMLFFMLVKRIQNVFLYKINPSLVSAPPWLMNRIRSNASVWKSSEINELLSVISDIDYESKTSNNNYTNGLLRLLSTL